MQQCKVLEQIQTRMKGKTMNLKVRRTEKLKTDLFHVGDVISFRMTTGEKVEMLAVKSEFDGMIFCFVDCLADRKSVV